MPNEQWDDFALTQQFTALDKRLEIHEHSLEGLSHFPIDVAKAALEIEHLAREIQTARQDLGKDVAAVAATCASFRDDWQASVDSKQKYRGAIVAAVITGCFTVLVAVIYLAAQLAGAG